MKANGKILHFTGEPTETADTPSAAPEGTPLPSTLALPKNPFQKAGLALVPFTPVPLSGSDALYGWGRLAVYGTLTYLTFSKHRKLSYAFGAAAVLSLITSAAGGAWDNAKAKI